MTNTRYVVLLVILLCGVTTVLAGEAESSAVDFSVLFDRAVYYRGDTPRIIVSGPASLAGAEFSLAYQFGDGIIVRVNDPRYRLQADGFGALYTGTYRPQHKGDEGRWTYFVTLKGVTKAVSFTVAGERPEALRCSGSNSVAANEKAEFRATGGTGAYRWIPPVTRNLAGQGLMEGFSLNSGADVLTILPAPPVGGKLDRRIITVYDGVETAFCLVEVTWPK